MTAPRSSRPTGPAAAASACAPAGAQEELPRGTWQIVVTEIPYLVQKSRLIEKIAELLTAKKLPLLADVRDESAEDVRLVLEPKSRTVDPDADDGAAVPQHRARSPHPAQHERAEPRQGAEGDEPARGAARMAGPPQGRAGPPLQLPPGRDRAAARDPRRLSRRLSQSRRGDPHHPRGGRAEARADGALQADRQPGRGHPQHAPARPAQARGNGNPRRAHEAHQGTEGAEGAAQVGRRAVGEDLPTRSRT